MPRTTDTTIAVTDETKQILDSFSQKHVMISEEVIQTLIKNSLVESLEDGIPLDTDIDTQVDTTGKIPIGAECKDCGHRVLELATEGVSECPQCGGNVFNRVVGDMDMVFLHSDSEQTHSLDHDMLVANTSDD